MKWFGWFRKKPAITSTDESPQVVNRWNREKYIEDMFEVLHNDMKTIRANRVEIVTKDGPVFRGVTFKDGAPELYNTDTFEKATFQTVYDLGIVSGTYSNSSPQRYYTKNSEYTTLREFTNEVRYDNCPSVKKCGGDVKVVARLGSLEIYNQELIYHFYTNSAGVKWYTDMHNLRVLVNSSSSDDIAIMDAAGIVMAFPRFVAAFHRNKQPIVPCDPDTGMEVEVRDPIRITELGDGERLGEENYVCLVPGKIKGTRHRHRYLIELDTEVMYANTIVSIYAVFKALQSRIDLMEIGNDGRLYVDSIRCYRRDGTTHTFDPAGFSSIGCEVHFTSRSRVRRDFDPRTCDVEDGIWLITNTEWPEEASY